MAQVPKTTSTEEIPTGSHAVTDATGAPVTDLTTARITVDLGDGYYQLNWKAPNSYAKSCKTLQLDLGEGSGVRTARFAFTK